MPRSTFARRLDSEFNLFLGADLLEFLADTIRRGVYRSMQGSEGGTIRLGLGWIIIRIECGGLSLEASLLCLLAAC
jgi:hypothetical protein